MDLYGDYNSYNSPMAQTTSSEMLGAALFNTGATTRPLRGRSWRPEIHLWRRAETCRVDGATGDHGFLSDRYGRYL